MKEILKELCMPSLTWKQRLTVWYFALSFCSLCVSDETPLSIVLLIVLNFANSARLICKVQLPETEKEERV
ncbi:MAG: hypothetical protein LBV47_05155 [Bacteroidales bacterium]|nr:hypothetical protein [Bacteroidales bacterium]